MIYFNKNELENGLYRKLKIKEKAPYLVPFLMGTSFSIYLVTIRTKIGSLNQEDYSFMILLTSMETIPGVLSVVSGYYSDKFGEKIPISFGFLASFLLAVFPFVPLELLPPFVFSYISMYMLYSTTIYGKILRKAEGSGKKLSILLMMFSIGWTCGGLFPSFLSLINSIDFGFLASSLLLMISARIVMPTLEPQEKKEKYSAFKYSFKEQIKQIWKIAIGLILWASGYYMLSGVFSLKLYNSVSNQFEYGIYFTVITGLASIMIRPYAGRLVDKISPFKVLIGSIFAYLLLSIALIWAPPFLVVLLWILPIYPFFDTGSYSLLSRMMPYELQSTAAGIINTSISLGGCLNLILYYFLENKSFEFLLIVDSAVLASSIIWLILFSKK